MLRNKILNILRKLFPKIKIKNKKKIISLVILKIGIHLVI